MSEQTDAARDYGLSKSDPPSNAVNLIISKEYAA